MAYTKVEPTAVQKIMTSFNKFEKIYEVADKKSKAQLKDDLEEKAKKMKVQLDADIEVYYKNAAQRYTNVDNHLARAHTLINAAKVAIKKYKEKWRINALDPALCVVAEFQGVTLLEKQDDAAYNPAQILYRANIADFSFMEKLFGTKYTKRYNELRLSTIEEGKKHIGPKLESIRQLAEVAVRLQEDADELVSGAKASVETTRDKLVDVMKTVKLDIDSDSGTTFGGLIASVTAKTDSVINHLTKGSGNIEVIQSIFSDGLGVLKSAKSRAQVLKEKIDSGIEKIDTAFADDTQITAYAKILQKMKFEIDDMLKSGAKEYKRGFDAMNDFANKQKKK